ncbi:unnamed protein product [Rhizoctonia solani]|uniref:Uncharacterized protein n=1 Tax=Rhizoctonia solani TaxID=456999 RepID=A0A8H2WVW2_9AGAM|nr:unnamed protein product [Rhizoctonia solani]
MSQYRLRSYGYAMVEEDRNAGWVLAYEDPEVSAARGRGKLWPGDLLREKELFELAEWIANRKGTDYDRRQYFKFKAHRGNLPFKNLDEMYHAIDNFEHGPEYKHFTFEMEAPHGADVQHVYSQNPVDAIEGLIGEPEWKDQMSYAPRKEWVLTADGQKRWVFDEMASGDYWARLQAHIIKSEEASQGSTSYPLFCIDRPD